MATDKYINIKVNSKGAETNIKRLDNEMTNLGREVDKTNDSFSKLSRVAAAVGTALATAQVTKYADAYTSLQNQIRQTVTSTEQLQKRTEQLLEVSNRSRIGLTDTASLYTNLVLTTKDLNLSTEENIRLTETIAKSFVISGKTAAESAGSIRQLGQSLAQGVLRGEEFNSIVDGAPEIMRALQRSLGKTQGELKKMADSGLISSKILVNALQEAEEAIDKGLNNSVVTVAQNFQIAENNLTKFIGESTTVQSVFAGLGDAVVLASENLEAVVDLLVVGASIMAARTIPALIQYTTATVANTAAQLTNTKAVGGVSAALGVQAAAATRSTVATNALTLASRGFSTVMATLGGPVGLLIVAAAALATFGSDAETARAKVDRLTGVTNDFSGEIKNLTRATKANLLNNINAEIIDTSAQITKLNQKIERIEESAKKATRGASGLWFQAGILREEVKALNGELDILSAKAGAIVTPISTEGFTDRGNINQAPAETKKVDVNQQLAAETAAIQQELQLRKAIADGLIAEAEAEEVIRFTTKLQRAQSFYEAELLKLGENELAKEELTTQFRENQLALVEEYEANLTDITASGERDRLQLKEESFKAEDSLRQAGIGNAVQLLQVLGRESKAAALIGIAISKAQALGANAVATASGSTLAFAAQQVPGDPSSFARGTAAAAKVKALGAIIAGLIVATGLAQGASALSGGGSSAGLGATSSGGSYSSTTSPAATESVRQTRAVDIRTDGSAFSEAVKEAALVLFNNDDDVVINITNQQQELVRTGAINV